MKVDPVELTKKLINSKSETPNGREAIIIITDELKKFNFNCEIIERNGISNLFARWNTKNLNPTFCFNGHVDVVPAGDKSLWFNDPYKATEKNDFIFGRGACDMKSAVAAFVSASTDTIKNSKINGSIVITLTSDEEGVATDGTLAILDWMQEKKQKVDHCLVGEPTCMNYVGDTIKVGRRGSLNVKITANGTQGHVAYPEKALNPINGMSDLIFELTKSKLDEGNEIFDESKLNITNLDTNNKAKNIIPSSCELSLNIRYNNIQTKKKLLKFIDSKIKIINKRTNVNFSVDANLSGEPFFNTSENFTKLIENSIESFTGKKPILSTSGGTSDARFIKNHFPVLEFGLVGETMHEVNEKVKKSHIYQLTDIYKKILLDYFKEYSR